VTDQELAELRYLIRKATGMHPMRLAGCVGKVGYETRSDAEKAIRPHKRGVISAYRCWSCHRWHVGTRKKHFHAKEKS
jgi:hypothetical protein